MITTSDIFDALNHFMTNQQRIGLAVLIAIPMLAWFISHLVTALTSDYAQIVDPDAEDYGSIVEVQAVVPAHVAGRRLVLCEHTAYGYEQVHMLSWPAYLLVQRVPAARRWLLPVQPLDLDHAQTTSSPDLDAPWLRWAAWLLLAAGLVLLLFRRRGQTHQQKQTDTPMEVQQ